MARLGKMAVVGIGTAIVAYLFDRDLGRGRRAKLIDQSKALVRRTTEAARKQAEYQSNRLGGLTHQFKPGESGADYDDATIRQKVKSEVMGPAQLSNVEVDVRNGVVTLSGDLEDSQYRDLMMKIMKISGVQSVDQMQSATASREDGRGT
jgi:osmotically-inducible protein OsmY